MVCKLHLVFLGTEPEKVKLALDLSCFDFLLLLLFCTIASNADLTHGHAPQDKLEKHSHQSIKSSIVLLFKTYVSHTDVLDRIKPGKSKVVYILSLCISINSHPFLKASD